MMQEVNTRSRLTVIGIVVLALFAAMGTRLWFLQVGGGEQLAVAAEKNTTRIVRVPAVRGSILDADGRVLAETVQVNSLTVDPQTLTPDQRTALVPNAAVLLSVSEDEINARIDNTQLSAFAKRPLATEVNAEQATAWAEHRDQYPGTELTVTYERRYPEHELAAHVVGYVGRINAEELTARRADGYNNDDIIGKSGVERLYESELRGTPRVERVSLDSRGRIIDEQVIRESTSGHDLRLTIDLDVQVAAERALAQGMDGSRNLIDPEPPGGFFPAPAGAVVVLDARSGALVAMASNPTYDPNVIVQGGATDALFDPNGPLPLFNRALGGEYAPGSTFKAISSIATLQYGIRTADETYYDDGCFEFGNDEAQCNSGKAENGVVDMVRAIVVSSDTFFYNAGNEFWQNYRDEGEELTTKHAVGYGIHDTAKAFGFGAMTGIGFGDDRAGRVPDLAFNLEINKSSDDPTSRTWRRGDSTNMAVGQGDVLVTPLQLANAYATIDNGGTLFTPRVVSAIHERGIGLPPGQFGPLVRTLEPTVKTKTGLTPEARATVIAGLEGVVNNGEGTAFNAFRGYDGPLVAGKTGTAQRVGKKDTSWFAAMTNPQQDSNLPQYAVVSVVEQGGFGADVSAPIVRRIMEALNGNPDPAPVQVGSPKKDKQD